MLIEELESQVEQLTLRLSSTQLDSKLLTDRALAHEKLGHMDKAFADLRAALSDGTDNPEAKQALERVLMCIQERQAQSTDSLYDLVRIATSKTDILSKRINAARNLASLSHEAKVCMHIVQDNLFEQLVDAVSNEPDPVLSRDYDESIDPSLRLLLLHTISNVTAIPDASAIASNCFLRGNGGGLESFMGSESPLCTRIATDCVISTITFAATCNKAEDRLSIARATIALKAIAARCGLKYSASVQKTSLVALIKASANQDLVLAIFTLPEFALVLQHVANEDESFRMSVSALLARCFEHISPSIEVTVLNAFSKTITACLNSSLSAEISCGLLALAAVFDARPKFGGELFKKTNLLTTIVDLEVNATAETNLHICKALVSACNDSSTRQVISSQCVSLLLNYHRQTSHVELRAASSLALIKLMYINKSVQEELLKSDKILDFFAQILKDETKSSLRCREMAIEAFSYLSAIPNIKEKLSTNTEILKLLSSRSIVDQGRAIQYGIATILANITAYRKQLTAEQKHAQKLHELANAQAKQPTQNISNNDPLDEDTAVAARVKRVATAGTLNTLGTLSGSDSINVRDAVSQTYLSIATDQSIRGLVIQQGGCRSLIELATLGSDTGKTNAAQALAKIAITSDPNLAFKGQMVFELVRPLLILCKGSSQLCQFEALMALTNIASVGDEVRAHIFTNNGIKIMEELQFADHIAVRRAATESLCNMMYYYKVMEMYTDFGSSPRLKIMVALSDSEDFATRRAASGAIAVLSSDEKAVNSIVKQNRVFEILVDLAKEESPELKHRAIESIKNIAMTSKENAQMFINAGIVQILTHLAKGNDPSIAEAAVYALKYVV